MTELTQLRTELLDELHNNVKRKYMLTQKCFYEYGKKSGKMLARALQAKKVAHTIHSIVDPSGKTMVESDDIAAEFVHYYTNLYNIRTPQSSPTLADRNEAIHNFLCQYAPSPIQTEDSASLDVPLTAEEITLALKQMKPGKSPGPDGLTVGNYKSFPDLLLPHLIKAFNNLSPTNTASKDILEAHITLIPKSGKDDKLVSNYHPISLLNVDVKLYAKAIANHLLPLIPNLITTSRFCPRQRS